MASMQEENLSIDEGASVLQHSPNPSGGSEGIADSPGDPADVVAGTGVGEIFTPVNLFLLALCAFLLYQIIKGRRAQQAAQQAEAPLKPMKKRDFTLEQLRQYNGTSADGTENRILIAVNGKVFDVTKGKKHYAPGGPYGVFAGRDASRGLGTFSLTDNAIRDKYDDLSDLKSEQMESIREWEEQFTEKYDLVGRLLKPGEEATDYSDIEEESHSPSSHTQDRTKSD